MGDADKNTSDGAGAQIIAGLMVTAIGGAGTWVWGLFSDVSMPGWWYLVGIAATATGASAFYRPWRRATWGRVRRWRPFTTTKTLDAQYAAGREAYAKDIAARQERPISPAQFFVFPKRDAKYTWVIANVAMHTVAEHVTVSAAPHLFQPGSKLFWESLNGSTAPDTTEGVTKETFREIPSEDGGLFGIDFSVEWTDANGVRQHQNVNWNGWK